MVCAAAVFLLFAAPARAQTPALPSVAAPAPPDWQQELAAVRLLDGTLAITPAKDAAEAVDRDARVAQLYRDLAHKYPDRSAVQKASGDYARRHERLPEAIAALQRAQTLEPGDGETADMLGSTELQLGHTRVASEQFQRAVDARPDNAGEHYTLANVLFLFRHDVAITPTLPDESAVLNKSLAEFRRAAELEPGNLQYAQSYAETFYQLIHPDWEQARTAWKAVLALSPANSDFANTQLARVSLRMKRPADVDGYLALVLDPRFASLKTKLHEQAARLPPAATPTLP